MEESHTVTPPGDFLFLSDWKLQVLARLQYHLLYLVDSYIRRTFTQSTHNFYSERTFTPSSAEDAWKKSHPPHRAAVHAQRSRNRTSFLSAPLSSTDTGEMAALLDTSEEQHKKDSLRAVDIFDKQSKVSWVAQRKNPARYL